jgi:MYND finger/Sel1 repeat
MDSNQEQDFLRAEVGRIRIAISQVLPDFNDVHGCLARRHALQRELEVTLDRQAEVEELARIEEVRRDAVASGLILYPIKTSFVGDCTQEMARLLAALTSSFGDEAFSMEDVLPPARAGHAIAQHLCGTKADQNSEEARVWFTLSAAQGYALAQYQLGEMYCSESGGVPQSYPKALYWLRKAGFQRVQEAVMLLLSTVILAKASLYDGKPDIVGYRALPEATFWAELARQAKGLCGVPDDDDDDEYYIPIRRCAGCKAVGYCGTECQKKHWKMGHKTDCQGVIKLREKVHSMSDIADNVAALMLGGTP